MKDDKNTKVRLAPTFAMVVRFAQRLRERYPDRIFAYFLDNLFLNVDVAQTLLALRICCCGTTRKNAAGVPAWLITLKNHNSSLVWNSVLGEVVDQTLCFAWQDNNTVIGITTAHRFKDETVYVERKRASPTSTNARIVRPVFGDQAKKWLYIPKDIDDYNNNMNGVDRADHLRANLTCHRSFERRTWRPLWNFLLDLCRVDSYLLSRKDMEHRKKRRGQRPFVNEITEILLDWPHPLPPRPPSPPPPPPPSPPPPPRTRPKLASNQQFPHQWVKLGSRRYCIWCKEHPETWKPKLNRIPLAPIVNSVQQKSSRTRQSQSSGGCAVCNVWLCSTGNCFQRFHSNSD